MPTVVDLLALVDDEGYITIERVQEKFGYTAEKACRILLRLSSGNEPALLPTLTSAFARPAEGSLPPRFGGTSGSHSGEGWYHRYLDTFRQLPSDIGYTKRDVMGLMGCGEKMAEGLLTRMMKFDGWVMRASRAGGSHGRRPHIWGKTHEAIDRREQDYLDIDAARKLKKRSKKSTKSSPLMTAAEFNALKARRDRGEELSGEELRRMVQFKKEQR